jgi:NarL family two-component system response regulator LiaR
MVLRLEPDLEVVGEAANGRNGLEAARGLNPDIVLVDLVMPEMDGQEMALA